jgi:predicted lipoprotein with Yx(FWY)xxD motif
MLRTATSFSVVMALLAGLSLAKGSSGMAAMPAELARLGFSEVLATVTVYPEQGASLTLPDQATTGAPAGYATFDIAPGTFGQPVEFQVLAGSNLSFDRLVSKNLLVVANFAYRVVSIKTGMLVTRFLQPITYALSDSMVNAHTQYWALIPGTTPKVMKTSARVAMQGTTLRAGQATASVGWLITTPRSDLAEMMGTPGSSALSSPGMRAQSGSKSSAKPSSGSMGSPAKPSSAPTGMVTPLAPVRVGRALVGGKSEAVLVDAAGMTLYYFTPDSAQASMCTGVCAKFWPPLLLKGMTSLPAHLPSLPGSLRLLEEAAGQQLEYNGHPLYTFSGDKKPGQARGEGLVGKWFVATPGLAQQ